METIIKLKNPETLKNFLNQAKLAGMPEDQVRNFVNARYVPLPKMMWFHAAAREADRHGSCDEIGQGGARGPGKTHGTLAQIGLDDCQRYDGLKFLFLRKVAKSTQESFGDLIPKIFRYIEHNYKTSLNRLEFPNSSSIVLGGFNNEGEIDKYLGIEYDGIALEEATQISEMKYLMLLGSKRSTKPGWRERIYNTTNPGGIGHAWYKKRFLVPFRTGTEQFTKFIPSTYKDNPFLSVDYVRYLESLPGALGRAWRDGDWDTFEGMAFPQWEYDNHTCEPFEIPAHWPKWRAVDWGLSAPFCALWFARDPDIQRIFVYRELYFKGLSDLQQIKLIKEYSPSEEQYRTTFMDPAMWSRNRQDEYNIYSTADIYQDNGIQVTKADNDRLSGKRKFDRVLGDLPDGKPGIVFFRNCSNSIRTIPELIYDKIRPEDVDSDMEDHSYDTVKYGLSDIREIKEPAKQKQQNPYLSLKGI